MIAGACMRAGTPLATLRLVRLTYAVWALWLSHSSAQVGLLSLKPRSWRMAWPVLAWSLDAMEWQEVLPSPSYGLLVTKGRLHHLLTMGKNYTRQDKLLFDARTTPYHAESAAESDQEDARDQLTMTYSATALLRELKTSLQFTDAKIDTMAARLDGLMGLIDRHWFRIDSTERRILRLEDDLTEAKSKLTGLEK
ncbi:hypothetical protein NDU88_007572 [Pleurodeles waltl]|uniref:Uncharacterized protein n=1 Tax=Pleurodeles waltl TaxID=8319 RepID=A0AAV7SSS5_PLEWA|nr:hypothetical protein NDU88_007572 [Pleurodeles waltl]